MNKSKKTERISIGLDAYEAELLTQATRVACLIQQDDPADQETARQRCWIVNLAIRAVCVAILDAGCMPLPLAVDMRHATKKEVANRLAKIIVRRADPRRAAAGGHHRC